MLSIDHDNIQIKKTVLMTNMPIFNANAFNAAVSHVADDALFCLHSPIHLFFAYLFSPVPLFISPSLKCMLGCHAAIYKHLQRRVHLFCHTQQSIFMPYGVNNRLRRHYRWFLKTHGTDREAWSQWPGPGLLWVVLCCVMLTQAWVIYECKPTCWSDSEPQWHYILGSM